MFTELEPITGELIYRILQENTAKIRYNHKYISDIIKTWWNYPSCRGCGR